MAAARYHPLSSLLHWIVVGLLVWQIWVGRALEGLINRGFAFDAVIAAYAQHKAVGMAILALTLIRIALRLMTAAPAQEAGVRGQAATWVQRGLYALLLAYPVTGFAYHSATTGFKTPVAWGALTFPDLPMGGEAFWHGAHEACLLLLGLLLALHLAGALFHLMFKRDGVFRRILPF